MDKLPQRDPQSPQRNANESNHEETPSDQTTPTCSSRFLPGDISSASIGRQWMRLQSSIRTLS